MTIEEVSKIVKQFIGEPIKKFRIERNIFQEEKGRKLFNKKIRENTLQKPGVYIWVNTKNEDIIYFGMAGKINTDGSKCNHTIRKRLLASRGKDKKNKKEIQTNDFIHKVMVDNEIDSLDMYIIYSKNSEPPAYIEALLLYKYYKKYSRLPKLNNSF